MANNSISLVNLDFDGLKASLKTYLKAQPQFTDYDFDGSNMSVLLDILSYNTHLNAFYMNMAVSEMFLDSAQLRNSVISRAKELNYIPRSAKSSEAQINVRFPQTGLSVLSIPSGTKFTGKSGNGTFTYTTNQSHVIYPSGGYFTANLNIYEGIYISDAFVVDSSIEAQRFVMTNDNIDTDSMVVLVSENNGQTNTYFNLAPNLYGLTSNSTIYFLQSTEDTRYEIVFGDGVFGRKPLNNALVYTTYRTCSGSFADGSTNFTLDDNIGAINGLGSFLSPSITVFGKGSSGGASAETIDSIRYNAPRHYQTQDRAVTMSDFKNMVLGNFTEVKTVNVFGGESVVGSVQFGKVFITPVTYSGATLSDLEKQNIETYLQNKCTLGIKPKVINPNYLYLLVTSKVKFDSAATIKTLADVQSIVNQAIGIYDTEYLTDFDIEFKLSRLEAAINDSDQSISSNETTIVMRKDVNPDLNTDTYIDINYRNAIVPGSFSSTTFISGGRSYQYTDYNPINNTFLINQLPGGKIVVTNSSKNVYLKDVTLPGYESYSTAGSINYVNGAISLNQIMINGFVDSSSIQFFASPANQDIMASGNDLIQIDLTNLNITVVPI
jgi:hypothetical protein